MPANANRTKTAVILAAGMGSRLMPLTADRPKVLVEVGGKPLLERLLTACERAGLDEIIVVTGYRHEQIDAFLTARAGHADICTVFNEAFDTLGNAHSLFTAKERLTAKSFIKMDGDLLLDPTLIAQLAGNDDRSVLAYDRKAVLDAEAMKAKLSTAGTTSRVTALGKWLTVEESEAETIGVEHIAAQDGALLFETIDDLVHRRGDKQAYYEDAYHHMLLAGWQLDAFDIGPALWTEIDDHADLARAAALCQETGGWD